jgi:hypothetical protein
MEHAIGNVCHACFGCLVYQLRLLQCSELLSSGVQNLLSNGFQNVFDQLFFRDVFIQEIFPNGFRNT